MTLGAPTSTSDWLFGDKKPQHPGWAHTTVGPRPGPRAPGRAPPPVARLPGLPGCPLRELELGNTTRPSPKLGPCGLWVLGMKTLRRHPVQRPSNGFLCPTQNGFSAFGGLARAIGRWEGTRGGCRVLLGCTGLDPPLKGGPGRFDVPPGRAAHFTLHSPSNLAHVDEILTEFEGQHAELRQGLREKYGVGVQ